MSIRKLHAAGTCVASALILSLTLGASQADARERGARAEGRAPAAARQGNWTRTSERQRTDNGWTRSDRWQGANGKEATRDVSVVNDKEAGKRSRSVDWTGPNGGTRSMDRETTRTENGRTTQATVTNANGQTATRETSVVNDKEAGVRTRESQYTTFDGRSGGSTTVTTRTDSGFTRETSGTLPNGNTFERSVVKDCDRASGKCSTTVENNGGANQP